MAYYYQLGTQFKAIDTTFYYIIPYGAVTYLGYHYANMRGRIKKRIAVCFCILFVVLACWIWASNGMPIGVQHAKYPPRIYYLSYGIACSFGLLMLCEKHSSAAIFKNGGIQFVSMHSMWLYFWHILILDVYRAMNLPEIWVLKLIIVYVGSALMVIFVNLCLDYLEKWMQKDTLLRYLRG